MHLLYDLVIPFPGIYSKDSCYCRETLVHPCLFLLFSQQLRNGKPNCLSTDEAITRTWYIYIMGFYRVVKKDEIMKHAGKWMEVGTVTPSDVTQT